LIDSDVTETSFDLPPRMYSFDASTFNAPAGIASEVPCGVAPVADCCNPTPPLPAPDCTATPLTCEQNENGMNVCTATVPVSQASPINLGQECRSCPGSPASSTSRSADRLHGHHQHAERRPSDVVYLAAQGVTDPADPSARKFGTLPAILAGTTAVGDVSSTRRGRGVQFVRAELLSAPFNFIAATTLR
jgi:hypothetical protein